MTASDYQNAMPRYHASGHKVCQKHVQYLLDLPNKQFNRTIYPSKPIEFRGDPDQQKSTCKIRS